MNALNKPIYNDEDRVEYSGFPDFTCPWSGLQIEGCERGDEIFLGAAMEGRISHAEYTDRDLDCFIAQRQNTYIVEPYGVYAHERNKAAIIVIMDHVNIATSYESKLLCDQFAAAGYLTVMPNVTGRYYQNGAGQPHADDNDDVIIPSEHREGNRTLKEKAAQVATAITYLTKVREREDIGVASYGSAELLLRFMRPDPPYPELRMSDRRSYRQFNHHRIAAGFVADSRFSEKEMQYWDAFKDAEPEGGLGPISIAVAEQSRYLNDTEHKEKRNELLAHLFENPNPYQFTIYSHVFEKFAVSRKAKDKAQVFAKKQAFTQAITWFDEFLLNGD